MQFRVGTGPGRVLPGFFPGLIPGPDRHFRFSPGNRPGAGRVKLRDEISISKYFLLNTGILPGVNWIFTIFSENTGYFSGCELNFLKICLEIPGFSPGVNYNFHFSFNFAAFFILR